LIKQQWEFQNSKAVTSTPKTFWTIGLLVKQKGRRRGQEVTATDPTWQRFVVFIRSRLPSILYFPNFLFELPDKIYLEAGSGAEEGKHQFYRGVIQDILDAIGEQATLNEHVLARAKSGTTPDRRSLESVLLKMGSPITSTVFTSWNKIDA
jgi:hypothetical protein